MFAVIESASETAAVKGQGEGEEATLSGNVVTAAEDVETSSSSDGKREDSLTLAGFDILRFKNNFLEARNVQIWCDIHYVIAQMVEELRLQRVGTLLATVSALHC